MGAGSPHFRLVRHPLAVRKVEVAALRQLSPKMLRITFRGAELSGFVSLSPEDHVKVFFPQPGERIAILPQMNGAGRLLPGSLRQVHARDYTPVRFDERRLELDLDFYLHGAGVAARWAAAARVGDQLGLAGPRGSFVLTERFSRHVFVGDETAWPEFVGRMRVLEGATRCEAVAVVDSESERQEIPRGAHVSWIYRASSSAETTQAVVECLRALAPFDDETFLWIAGEAEQTRAVLVLLRDELGVEPARMNFSGHWKLGKENHDHHEPLEA